MSKRLDELSMDLASGMSRRKALWRFLAGSGAALFMLRKAKADGNDACVAFCMTLSQNSQFSNSNNFFGQCVSASAQCPDGHCAIPIAVNLTFQSGAPYSWVCCRVG